MKLKVVYDVYLFVMAEDHFETYLEKVPLKQWNWKDMYGKSIQVCNLSLFIMNKTVYWIGKV